MNNDNKPKKLKKYRLDLLFYASLFILLFTFCAYMINTTLEETLSAERGQKVVTHDYTFDDSQESSGE